MYRYSPHMRNVQSASQLKERIRSVVMIVLIAAVIALAIFGGRAMTFRSDAHTLFVKRIQVECNDALSLTNSLSRTAGASSSSTLGKIRSHVYSMETINSLNVGLEGSTGYLIQEGYFTNLYSILDDYANKLITGMTTGDAQSSLLATLTELYSAVEMLE